AHARQRIQKLLKERDPLRVKATLLARNRRELKYDADAAYSTIILHNVGAARLRFGRGRKRNAYRGYAAADDENASKQQPPPGPYANSDIMRAATIDENWSTAPLANETNSDDCEEGGIGSPCIWETMRDIVRNNS